MPQDRGLPIPIHSISWLLQARCYNCVRLGLRRLHNPLRVELGELRGLTVVLSDQRWYCIDPNQNDLPVLEWTAFEIKARQALHEPVRCKLHFYHYHAGLVMSLVLDALERRLNELLADTRPRQV